MNAITRIFAVALGMTLAAVALPASAQSCGFHPGESALQMTFPLTGTVTVGRDLKVGDMIYGGTGRTYSEQRLTCRGVSSFDQVREFTRDPGTAVLPGTYPTNVAGIGVRVWYAANLVPWTQPFAINDPSLVTDIRYIRSLDFTLVKTGPITGGVVHGSMLPGVRHSARGWTDLATYTFVGDLTVVTGTCSVRDFTVPMGAHQMTELSGVGTATAWKDFDIALTNCPAFFGAAWYDNWDGGTNSEQYRNANTVKLRIDPATSIVDAANSVMALQQGSNYMARNIGIQIAARSNSSFGFGVMRGSGVTLTNAANGNYNIPLRARYIQTGANPSSGEANGAMTVTLEYL